MRTTQPWFESIAPAGLSRRQLWFGLIRTVVVVALVGSAARLIAMAYWPQSSAPRSVVQELSCPPLSLTNADTVVSAPPLAMTAASNTSDEGGNLVVDQSLWRAPITKQEERRSASKKQPVYTVSQQPVYALPRKAASPKPTGSVELAKHERPGMNQPKSKRASPAPMLAQAGIYLSPFGDMHGQ